MFINKIIIDNFRLYPPNCGFGIDSMGIPDGKTLGSGLTVLVGKNGSGKSAVLDALALPMLEYKAEAFSVEDINDVGKETQIDVYSDGGFKVDKTIKGEFTAKGLSFRGHIREKDSRVYLSSVVVSDQLFISEDSSNPKAGSSDLRTSVNNPFKGKRFSENDVIYLDSNRVFQIRSGTYNMTRFDRLMQDFNFQYIKSGKVDDLNKGIDAKVKKDRIDNEFLASAIQKFKEISGFQVKLDFLENYEPFKSAFFSVRREKNQQVSLTALGSGFEMVFALLYSFYLAKQSGKDLIVLIDEPELHLHPTLQESFVQTLLEFSKTSQVVIATHSPLLIKQLSENTQPITIILGERGKVKKPEERVLSYVSANEINFIAFELATEEYHNELYEELKYAHGETKSLKKFDNDYFVGTKGESKESPLFGVANEVSRHTFIRNQIHHRKENGVVGYDDLKKSIEIMRSFFK